MNMLKAISFLFVGIGLIYILFYPFLKHAVNRRKLFKWFIITYILAAIISVLSNLYL